MRYLVLLFGDDLSKSLLVSNGLKYGVPSEHVLATWCDDFAIALANKYYRFRLAVLAVGNYALCVGGFIWEARQEVM